VNVGRRSESFVIRSEGWSKATVATVVPLKQVLLVTAGVGVLVAVVRYACPQEVAAVVGGVAGACAAA
jgi:hypothetical protein